MSWSASPKSRARISPPPASACWASHEDGAFSGTRIVVDRPVFRRPVLPAVSGGGHARHVSRRTDPAGAARSLAVRLPLRADHASAPAVARPAGIAPHVLRIRLDRTGLPHSVSI